MDPREPLIFDGHNDTLTRLMAAKADDFREAAEEGQLNAVKARAGGFGGGLFAIWVRQPEAGGGARQRAMEEAGYDVPLPPALERGAALDGALREAALLLRLERAGDLRICTTTREIGACLAQGTLAAVMHMEGAEAVDPDLAALDVLYAAGLRSLGLVWSRPTIFAHGVPFRFPSGPDTGEGLSELGRDLVRRCNALGVMLDLSHLNEAGFWDVARLSDAPLVASHSNAHALCPHARNLTDDQLRAVGESGGLVGLNFAAAFLREDGRMRRDVPLDQVLRHLDHLIALVGEDGVGFGSDFDGATIPEAIGDAAGLPKLREAMRTHGYDEPLMRKLCHQNWLRVLGRAWNEN